ncbi:aminoacyl-tRNA hydrolase [Corynebacterium sp. CCUG 59401]|nr:aminoacyl-tRNA hydrolase [Corynebacterium pseudogenitalium]
MLSLFRARQLAEEDPAGLPDAKWLVVGLGNPGARYDATKHNVGYMVQDILLDQVAATLAPLNGHKVTVAVADGVAYARSTTFMNLSGEGIAPLARELGITPDHVVVLHDELDLPPGKVRIKLGGNENGHNGLKSLTEELGTRDYVRIRIGIGRPPKGMPVPEWVLSSLPQDSEHEEKALTEQLELAAEAAGIVVKHGVQRAQNEIHPRS